MGFESAHLVHVGTRSFELNKTPWLPWFQDDG
jgi:hypothetical protein